VKRTIDLDGCVNFRDLGGYPTTGGQTVRWRVLFRSDALHALSAADLVCLRDELRLSDIVDLRSTFELENDGRGPIADEPIAFHHNPLFDGNPAAAEPEHIADWTLGQRYLGLLDRAQEKITNVVRLLARADEGAVYHCSAGKDRTGVVSAVVLGALGVADELVVADFALSGERIDEIIDRVMSMRGYQEALHEMPKETLHAKPEAMEEVLAGVNERWGSMADYLRSGGLDAADFDRLRTKCLD